MTGRFDDEYDGQCPIGFGRAARCGENDVIGRTLQRGLNAG